MRSGCRARWRADLLIALQGPARREENGQLRLLLARGALKRGDRDAALHHAGLGLDFLGEPLDYDSPLVADLLAALRLAGGVM